MIYLNTRFMKTIKSLTLVNLCLLAITAGLMAGEEESLEPNILKRARFEKYVANDFAQEAEPLSIVYSDCKRLAKKLRKIQFRVNFDDQGFVGSDFRELASLSPTLYGIDLHDQNLSLEVLSGLPTFTQLRFLNLAGTHLQDEQLVPILFLGNLEHLVLTYNKITTSGLASLLILKNLHYLDVSSIYWDDNKKFNVIIPLFTQLRGLKASLCNLNDDCLHSFKSLSSLEFIDISGNTFSEKPLQRFLQYARSRNIEVIH